MNKRNLLFLILAIILTVAVVAAVSLLVKKYEQESFPAAQPVLRQVPEAVGAGQETSRENISPAQQDENQFPTENGKFLQ